MKALKPLLIVALAGLVGWPVLRAVRVGWYEYGLFRIPSAVPTMPADAAQLGLEAVEFPSRDRTMLRGWYIPSTTGASVVVAAGSSADRASMLAYARALRGSGLGLLLFDWPGTGASDGHIGMGAAERAALRGAVDFVARRPDVMPGRIGLLGFSLGAYTSLLVAADEPRVAAIVTEGAFRDFEQQALAEYADGGVPAQWGAILGARLGGMEHDGPDVLSATARISPRPMLFVAGTQDRTVPAATTQQVFDAARSPKQLWLIAGAEHGTYLTADTTYATRLRRFLAAALLQPDTSRTR